ncbi:hypothetical protein ANOBCDAF_04418 [Pleomorphomonas sp. T1.2MG-36]|nr:hypothetical protein ANOBCDAF_04418 [Pleomorphomonas sp. T1.2MG-36]
MRPHIPEVKAEKPQSDLAVLGYILNLIGATQGFKN